MTEADFGTLLMLFTVSMGFTLYVWVGPFRRERQKNRRYILFKVRDHLIWLVVTGKLSREDEVFECLYEGINDVIPKAEPLSLPALTGKIKKRFPVSETNIVCLNAALSHKDKEVRVVAYEFFSAIASTLLSMSFFIKVALATKAVRHRAGSKITTLKSLIPSKFFRPQEEAYAIYKQFNQIAQGLMTFLPPPYSTAGLDMAVGIDVPQTNSPKSSNG